MTASILPGTTLLDAPGHPATGRWTVVAAGSRLLMEARVCGMVGVRGRFTGVSGHVDVGSDLTDSRMRIDVVAASLTTGVPRRDALLTAAGLIDPAAGPLLRFRSRRIVAHPDAPVLRVEGVLGTDRAVAPLCLDVALPAAGRDTRELALQARGRIGRDVIGALLARPGTERLLGATAALDLTVVLRA